MSHRGLPPVRARLPSIDETVAEIGDAWEAKTLPGLGRRMNSDRVREILQADRDRRELKIHRDAERRRKRLVDQVKVGVAIGLIVSVTGSVVAYLAGRATRNTTSPPAAAAHP